MTRLLFLPDDQTVVQMDVDMTARQLAAAVNAGLRPIPLLQNAPSDRLIANILGNTVVIAPAVKRGRRRQSSLEKTQLTRRQRQVLELTSLGFSNAEIALTLGLSRRAVSYHLTHLRRRLHENSNLQTLDPIAARLILEEDTR